VKNKNLLNKNLNHHLAYGALQQKYERLEKSKEELQN